MFKTGIAIVAVATTLLATTEAAAQQVPAWPSPADVGNLLQQAASAAHQASAATGCPTIEVAPNLRLPVCSDSVPKLPAGVVIPDTVFPPVQVLPSVDLRTRGLDGPVLNQQQTGVCYAFAISNVLDNSLRRQGRPEVVAPLHVVASGTYGSLLQGAAEPLTSESTWPYDPRKACKLKTNHDTCEHAYGLRVNSWQSDPALVGERERARAMGFAKIQRATSLARDPIGGMVNALSLGRAAYLVVGIDSQAWSFSATRGGVLRDYTVADRGDHAVAAVGYRMAGHERQFLLHNSWGTQWGDGGYVWMSESAVRKHFSAAYLMDATPASGGGIPIPQLPMPNAFPGLQLPAMPAIPGLPNVPAWPWPQRA